MKYMLIALLLFSPSSHAASGLIFPFFTNEAGWLTLVGITNTGDKPATVRWREFNEIGENAFQFEDIVIDAESVYAVVVKSDFARGYIEATVIDGDPGTVFGRFSLVNPKRGVAAAGEAAQVVDCEFVVTEPIPGPAPPPPELVRCLPETRLIRGEWSLNPALFVETDWVILSGGECIERSTITTFDRVGSQLFTDTVIPGPAPADPLEICRGITVVRFSNGVVGGAAYQAKVLNGLHGWAEINLPEPTPIIGFSVRQREFGGKSVAELVDLATK